MPDASTMTTPPLPHVLPAFPPRKDDTIRVNGRTSPTDSEGTASGPPTPGRRPSRRRAKKSDWQPTFHLNIGRVEVPRSLPAVRSMGTQTDVSAVKELRQKEAIHEAKWTTRVYRWTKKWVWPVVKFGGNAIVFLLARVGIGFRGN